MQLDYFTTIFPTTGHMVRYKIMKRKKNSKKDSGQKRFVDWTKCEGVRLKLIVA